MGAKDTYRLRGGFTFEIDPRFEILKKIGQGGYGCLADGVDRRSGERVAIKKVANALIDAPSTKLALREVRLMRHFTHENILSLLDIMTPPDSPWTDLYLVLERFDTDLHFIIYSGQALSNAHVQWLLYQLLRGVKAIHSAMALHRDLKPSNLLVNKNCDLKICDFGLARGVDESRSPLRRRVAAATEGHAKGDAKVNTKGEVEVEDDCVGVEVGGEVAREVGLVDEPVHAPLTEYVVTRWYRAPELLVQNHSYGAGVDMWSIGCVLGECLLRAVLFQGKDYLEQTRLILEGIGAPSAETLARTVESRAAAEYIRLSRTAGRNPVARRMPTSAEPTAIALLIKLLAFDAAQRPSAASALDDTYFASLRGLNDEPDAPPFDFDFEEEGVGEDALRALVHEEMARFHPELQLAAAPQPPSSCEL